MKHKLTRISALHFFKLTYRSLLLIIATVLYIFTRSLNTDFVAMNAVNWRTISLGVIWLIFAVEMALRFFPSKFESMGCQKQFKRNFMPTETTKPAGTSKGAPTVLLSWLGLNGIVAALYFLKVIDSGILLLVALAYSVCDMICILFFCPFQTWMMKNKCCGSCRIYNWDFVMMFTPLVLVPGIYTWSLLAMAIALVTEWEIIYRVHPERFEERTNAHLSCANCPEKLCQHKKQLRRFLIKYWEERRLLERLGRSRE